MPPSNRNLTWAFSANDAGEPEGNNPSIAQFSENRRESLIRESIQNSLDAGKDEGKPVVVRFAPTEAAPAEIGADSLSAALRNCLNGLSEEEEERRRDFEAGLHILGSPPIKSLRIVDSNTTGAEDEDRALGASGWQALTKGTGIDAKSRLDAAGSWGFGKFAAFANSPIRTVLYTTAYEADGGMRHRHQGKTVQISHKDDKGKDRRATGYLGNEYQPLLDNDVPPRFRLSETGTSIEVIGYAPDGDWEDEGARLVVKHFFHAVLRQTLEVTIGQTVVNYESIEAIAESGDERTQRLLAVSRTDPLAQTRIEGIGKVNLYIQLHPDDRVRYKEIALVRDAGMMLTDNRSEMGMPRIKNLPSSLRSFTSIVECLSEGEPSMLRRCESPEHKRISEDYIENKKERPQARAALNTLGAWIRATLQEHAAYRDQGETKVDELAQYLNKPMAGRVELDGSGTEGEEYFGEPYQSLRSRKPDISREPRPGPKPDPNDPRPKPIDPRPPGPTPEPGPITVRRPGNFANLRFQAGRQHSTHSVRVTFDNPGRDLREITLIASGDEGQETQMGIREASVGGRKLPVHHGKIASLPQQPQTNTRVTLEIVTREPTINRAFRIKSGK